MTPLKVNVVYQSPKVKSVHVVLTESGKYWGLSKAFGTCTELKPDAPILQEEHGLIESNLGPKDFELESWE